jgi:hypothetical protein
MVPQRDEADGEAFRPHQHGGAANDELADTTFTKAATDRDALCVAPFWRLEETSDDRGKLAGELLDRSDQYSGSLRIARNENVDTVPSPRLRRSRSARSVATSGA